MKTSINYLPEKKQQELQTIVSTICNTSAAEMIILFGSYARNAWVEDKYDETHFRYQSDYDLLVLVETKSDIQQTKLEIDLESKIEQNKSIQTPVSILVHDIEFMNRRLKKAQYFFTDIKKEGILLFDTEKHTLQEAKELPPTERKKLAETDFKYYFNKAGDVVEGVDFFLNKGKLNEAVFLLHQVAERLYTGILLVFTRYKPNTHDLGILRKLTNTIDHQLAITFPLHTREERWLFKLLCKAYVDARYKPSYHITKEELLQLIERVERLETIGKQLCLEKIDELENS